MAYTKIPVAPGDVISSDWGNHIQTQYEEAKADLDNHANDSVRHITSTERSNWNNKADQSGTYPNLRAQATTKGDVGLGNVQNYGIATQAQAEAGTANNVYMTPLRVAQAIAALSPGIKSVQRGSGTIPFDGQTVNITISTINRNKAFVIAYSRGATGEFTHAITAELTSNTNLRITRGGKSLGNSTPFTWEVVEFN